MFTTNDLLKRIDVELKSILNPKKEMGITIGAAFGLGFKAKGLGDEMAKLIKGTSDVINKLEQLFKEFREACQNDTKVPFWFVLDDVNSMKDIIVPSKPESIDEFKSLIRLLVKASKQDGTCKALFGSTDSSLVVWMQELGFDQVQAFKHGYCLFILIMSDTEMDSYLKLIGIQKESIRRMLIDAFGGDVYRCLLSFGSPVLDNTENEEKF